MKKKGISIIIAFLLCMFFLMVGIIIGIITTYQTVESWTIEIVKHMNIRIDTVHASFNETLFAESLVEEVHKYKDFQVGATNGTYD